MKVLFLAPNLAAGGAERFLSILLPGLRERGWDARLLALDGGGPFEAPLRESGVPLEVLHMRSQAHLAPLLRSPIVRRFRPEAIVSSGVSSLYVGTAIARARGALNIYNEHRQVGLELSRRRETMVKVIASQLDAVIAVSAEQTAVWHRRGYPAQRIAVIPNGVAAHVCPESREEIRRALGIPEAAVVAVLTARLRPEKRVTDFVAAVRRARERLPGLVGVIAGDGPEAGAVRRAAGDDAGILVLGHRDDVPRLLHAADVFALTSDFEALPMAILEAMAAGLPVLATAVGDIPDVVTPEVTGLLVDPGDVAGLSAALERLAGDAGLRTRMGAQASAAHAHRFSAEAMIDAYARVLQSRSAARNGRPG